MLVFCECSHGAACCQNFNTMVCHKFATELMAHLVGRQDCLERRIYFQQGLLKMKQEPNPSNPTPFFQIFSQFKQANGQNLELRTKVFGDFDKPILFMFPAFY